MHVSTLVTCSNLSSRSIRLQHNCKNGYFGKNKQAARGRMEERKREREREGGGGGGGVVAELVETVSVLGLWIRRGTGFECYFWFYCVVFFRSIMAV